MSGFRGVRVSKFRHVYGQSSRREQCYEGLRVTTAAHDSQSCAANPKFIAVILEVAGGGAFQVLPLRWTGKVDFHMGRVSGHNGPVTDLKWNPFNDNVIASASEDGTVKLWHIPDEGVRWWCTSDQWLCELAGHSRRVSYIEWHPTAEGIMATVGFDCRVLIWNVSTGEILVESETHPDTIYSVAFNRNGSLMVTTCKDKMIRFLDPRSGQVIREACGHEGSKTSKALFLGATGLLCTTGFSKSSRRQLAIWSQNDLNRPLVMQEVDASSGVLFPFFDQDLNILYIAGKGDGNIRYYEASPEHPWLYFLSEFQSRFPQRGLGMMPKRGLDTKNCEIFRFFKLHTTQPLVEPLSFIVPRKSDKFQTDLYPPTFGPTPALTAEEWLCGVDREPVLASLAAPLPSVTSKPVQLKKALSEDGAEKALLLTSDRNNERKFQFLSQITRPDYRQVDMREDYPEIIKEKEIKEKLQEFRSHRNQSLSAESMTSGSSGAQSRECRSQEDVFMAPTSSPGAVSAPPLSQFHEHPSRILNGHSPKKIPRLQTQSPESSLPPLPSSLKPATPSGSRTTKPGRIIPGPIIPREQTATIKPFRISQSQPNTPRSPAQPLHGSQETELQRLYASQCRRVRELMEDSEKKSARVGELQQTVSSLNSALENLRTELEEKTEDVESLRYEIRWKDERIRYLESQIGAKPLADSQQ